MQHIPLWRGELPSLTGELILFFQPCESLKLLLQGWHQVETFSRRFRKSDRTEMSAAVCERSDTQRSELSHWDLKNKYKGLFHRIWKRKARSGRTIQPWGHSKADVQNIEREWELFRRSDRQTLHPSRVRSLVSGRFLEDETFTKLKASKCDECESALKQQQCAIVLSQWSVFISGWPQQQDHCKSSSRWR